MIQIILSTGRVAAVLPQRIVPFLTDKALTNSCTATTQQPPNTLDIGLEY